MTVHEGPHHHIWDALFLLRDDVKVLKAKIKLLEEGMQQRELEAKSFDERVSALVEEMVRSAL